MSKIIRRVSTFREKTKIVELLREHIEQLDNGNWAYKEKGWTDQNIVDLANAGMNTEGLNVNHVKALRKSEFGQLDGSKGMFLTEMREKLDQHDENIEALRRQFEGALERIATLEIAVGGRS